ncbi:MAG TPA: Mov34/MPN/PAD-1 family protein [Thermoleophilaceae bacterium]|nr:Mov34/MPN/PAD-1 family protein [Thermoleophilaceae bacterium]
MLISKANWDELIAHARDEAPNECCGYARLSNGRVEEVFRGVNERHSPYGFDLDYESLKAANNLDDDGFGVAIYHSHVRSAAEPSEQDKNIVNYPDWLYLIISLQGEPHIRAWTMTSDGKVSEEPLEVA